MLSYTGTSDYSQANLRVYGDGTLSTVTIDFSKNPFNLNFGQKQPFIAVVAQPTDDPVASVILASPNLTVNFVDPPPFVDPQNPQPAGRLLTIRFIYQ